MKKLVFLFCAAVSVVSLNSYAKDYSCPSSIDATSAAKYGIQANLVNPIQFSYSNLNIGTAGGQPYVGGTCFYQTGIQVPLVSIQASATCQFHGSTYTTSNAAGVVCNGNDPACQTISCQ